MRFFIYSILSLFFSSCGFNEGGTRIEIDPKDLSRVDSIMQSQVSLIKSLRKPDSVRVAGWEFINDVFYLNNIADSLITAEFLSEWNLSNEDYKILKQGSSELVEYGFCGAVNVAYDHTLAFMYACDLTGFDVKERIIMLKPQYLDGSFRKSFKVVLAENQYMVMGY